MATKKLCLIVLALLRLGGAEPATATDDEAAHGPASNPAAGPLNTAPRITGLERVSFAEHGQGVVATYSARDRQGHAIAWSLSGRDAGAFTFTADVDRHTMDLVFRSVPDYEHPLDVPPTDNDYQVTVVATDDGQPALATPYPVRVQVVKVDERDPRPVLAAPERAGHTTQAEQVGGVVRAVANYYKNMVSWALRGVVNHVRDVWNASKRTPRDASAPVPARVPDAPAVSVYSGAWSAAVASGRVQVSVGKPASNGSPLTGYEYQLYQGEDRLLDWTSAGVDATTLAGLAPGEEASFAVGGLMNGAACAVVVRAVNGVGTSGSVWVMATPGRLFAPDRLQAVAGDGLVDLTWSAAATEGPVITRYEWRGRPIWGDWSSWTPVAGEASARGHRVEGLENGVEYAFAVRAANPAGGGSVVQVAARPRGAEPAPDGPASGSPTEPEGSDPL